MAAMRLTLLCCLVLLFVGSVLAALPHWSEPRDGMPRVYPSRATRHLEPVSSIRVLHSDMHLSSPNVRTVNGHRQPMPDLVSIEFTVFGEDHAYDLEIVHLYAPYSTMEIVGADGIENVPFTLNSYSTKLDNGFVTATIREDGLMHVVVARDGAYIQIDPLTIHSAELHQSVFHQLSQDAPHGMVAYRSEDMITDGENLHACGEARAPEAEAEPHSARAPANFTTDIRDAGRRLLTVDPWTSCRSPWVPFKLFMGVGADYGFFKAAGGTTAAVTAYIGQMWTTINSVYLNQLNIFLYIEASIINTVGGTGTYAWNQDRLTATCPTINALLDTFTAWRKASKPTTQGIWHQLTDCYPPPGTVGLAWVGVLCSVNNGAGVSSYSSSGWLTVAHEVGHNHDASHTFQLGQGTTGGIMDYGDGKLNGEYQFNAQYSLTEMCTHITAALSTTSRSGMVSYAACWTSYAPYCGNSVIEDGEECDDSGTSGCCDMTTCRLKAGSQCTSGECCLACKYVPSSTTCGGGTGYCNNGGCTGAFCSYYGLTYCGTQTANPCKMQCIISSACNTMAGYTDSSTGLPLPVTIPDGVNCKTTPFSNCLAGACTAVASTVTYKWVAGAFTACSATCGAGTQTRTVVCQDSNTLVVADSLCNAATKNATSQSCNLGVCINYSWLLSTTWSTCTNDCGSGTQTTTVQCMSDQTPPVASATSLCTATQPATTRACNTQACPLAWVIGAWSSCTVACGTGGQSTRTITCARTQNGVAATVANSNCVTAIGAMDATTMTCNTQACASYDWVFSVWGTCSASCAPTASTPGSQTRTVECKDTVTNIAAAVTNCNSATKPASSQVCNTVLCSVHLWVTQPWSNCTVTCGGGTSTRVVYCWENTTSTVLSDEFCTTSRPAGSQACNTAACPVYHYTSGAWSTCSATCGGGMTTRSVGCYDQANVVAANSLCVAQGLTLPVSSGACNDQSCPTYIWYTGSYGSCSQACGGGYYNRTVACVLNGTAQIVGDALCGAVAKPVASGVCNTAVCLVYNWASSAWSDCSVVCGSGVRLRTTQCSDQQGNVAATANCVAAAQPTTQETCNTQACPVYWSWGQYGVCSKPCATGTMTRAVVCRDVATNVIVDSSQCLGSQPSTTADCNPQACPTWQPQSWSNCSTRCDDGIQTRAILCIDYLGVSVDIAQCTAGIPTASQPCSNLPCPHWHVNAWGPCSVVCGGGQQTRTTDCRMPHDDPAYYGRLADDVTLCPTTLPDLVRDCNLDPCTPYYWKPATWSSCSQSCGGGIQTTTVTCTATDTDTAADAVNCVGTAPSTSRVCNTWPCPAYDWYLLNGPAWSNCSAICGPGIQTRSVVCRNYLGVIAVVAFEIVADSYCANLVKPWASTQICSAPNCVHGYCQQAQCACSEGYTGDHCENVPSFGALTTNAGFYSSGVPAGEQLTLRWNAFGDLAKVSLLVQRQSWAYPSYLARDVPNTGVYLWTVPTTLAPAADYQVLTWFSPAVMNRTEPFSIADPCGYLSCGQFGLCIDGQCACIQGYSGVTCSLSPCAAAGCNILHSTCAAGVCTCTDGWKGTQCKTPPACTATCKNSGYVQQRIGAAVGVCSDCVCPNRWSGADCGTCPLVCKHGAPDSDCKKCVCGADSGYFGDSCECKYKFGTLRLALSDVSFVDDKSNSSRGAAYRFNETFVGDLAAAIPGAAATQFQVYSVARASPSGVIVKFKVMQTCSVSGGGSFAPSPSGRRLLQTVEIDILAAPSVDNMTTTLSAQLADTDSTLYRGVLTSSATSSSFVVTDPTSSEVTTTTEESGGVPVGVWIGIGAFLGVAAIAGLTWWCCQRSKQNKKDNDFLKSENTVEMPAGTSKPVASSPKPVASELALPPHWTQERDDKGQIYYYNGQTSESSWTRPMA